MSMIAPPRTAQVARRTGETAIELRLALDGPAGGTATTGDGFLDHLLGAFARHGGLRLEVSASADAAATGPHHLAEDCGIALGEAIRFAVHGPAAVPVGQAASGVLRFGSATRPMDDALVTVAVDLAGRPGLHIHNLAPTAAVADTGFGPAELTAWLGGIAAGATLTLHVLVHAGQDAHHLFEAAAKAAGAAIAIATTPTPGQADHLSTKGGVSLTLKPW
jgi:imidazoleglycerol-phosphate dehydratase